MSKSRTKESARAPAKESSRKITLTLPKETEQSPTTRTIRGSSPRESRVVKLQSSDATKSPKTSPRGVNLSSDKSKQLSPKTSPRVVKLSPRESQDSSTSRDPSISPRGVKLSPRESQDSSTSRDSSISPRGVKLSPRESKDSSTSRDSSISPRGVKLSPRESKDSSTSRDPSISPRKSKRDSSTSPRDKSKIKIKPFTSSQESQELPLEEPKPFMYSPDSNFFTTTTTNPTTATDTATASTTNATTTTTTTTITRSRNVDQESNFIKSTSTNPTTATDTATTTTATTITTTTTTTRPRDVDQEALFLPYKNHLEALTEKHLTYILTIAREEELPQGRLFFDLIYFFEDGDKFKCEAGEVVNPNSDEIIKIANKFLSQENVSDKDNKIDLKKLLNTVQKNANHKACMKAQNDELHKLIVKKGPLEDEIKKIIEPKFNELWAEKFHDKEQLLRDFIFEAVVFNIKGAVTDVLGKTIKNQMKKRAEENKIIDEMLTNVDNNILEDNEIDLNFNKFWDERLLNDPKFKKFLAKRFNDKEGLEWKNKIFDVVLNKIRDTAKWTKMMEQMEQKSKENTWDKEMDGVEQRAKENTKNQKYSRWPHQFRRSAPNLRKGTLQKKQEQNLNSGQSVPQSPRNLKEQNPGSSQPEPQSPRTRK